MGQHRSLRFAGSTRGVENDSHVVGVRLRKRRRRFSCGDGRGGFAQQLLEADCFTVDRCGWRSGSLTGRKRDSNEQARRSVIPDGLLDQRQGIRPDHRSHNLRIRKDVPDFGRAIRRVHGDSDGPGTYRAEIGRQKMWQVGQDDSDPISRQDAAQAQGHCKRLGLTRQVAIGNGVPLEEHGNLLGAARCHAQEHRPQRERCIRRR